MYLTRKARRNLPRTLISREPKAGSTYGEYGPSCGVLKIELAPKCRTLYEFRWDSDCRKNESSRVHTGVRGAARHDCVRAEVGESQRMTASAAVDRRKSHQKEILYGLNAAPPPPTFPAQMFLSAWGGPSLRPRYAFTFSYGQPGMRLGTFLGRRPKAIFEHFPPISMGTELIWMTHNVGSYGLYKLSGRGGEVSPFAPLLLHNCCQLQGSQSILGPLLTHLHSSSLVMTKGLLSIAPLQWWILVLTGKQTTLNSVPSRSNTSDFYSDSVRSS